MSFLVVIFCLSFSADAPAEKQQEASKVKVSPAKKYIKKNGVKGKLIEKKTFMHDESISILSIITDFHSVYDKVGKHEIRILQADASLTVAMNDETLWVVVTTGACPGPYPDCDTKVWEMPGMMSQVFSIKPMPMGVRISGSEDVMDDDFHILPRKSVFDVKYQLKDGHLTDELVVEKY